MQERANAPLEPPSEVFEVSGRVVKGAASGVQVAFYSPDSASVPITTAVTDALGYYFVSLPAEFFNKPVRAVASLQAGVAMNCDLDSDCDSAKFGEVLVLSEAMELQAVSEGVTGDNPVNITLLTSVAAKVADEFAEGTATNPAARYLSANSAVAKSFGLSGRLDALKIIDITDATEFETEDYYPVRYALLNAATLDTVKTESPSLSLTEASASAVSLLAQNIASGQSLPDGLDLVDVYESAVQLANRQSLNSVSAASVVSKLFTEIKYLNKMPAPVSWTQVSEFSTDLAPVDQAKNFIDGIRQIANTVDFASLLSLSSLDTLVSGEILGITEVFGISLAQDGDALKDIPEFVSVGGSLLQAALLTVVDFYSDQPLPESVNGIAIDVTINDTVFDFKFTQAVVACDGEPTPCVIGTDVRLVMDISSIGGNADNNTLALGGTASITGTMAATGTVLDFPGQADIYLSRITVNMSSAGDADEFSLSGRDIYGRLPFRQTTITDENYGKVVEGELELSAQYLDFEYSDQLNPVASEGYNRFLSETHFVLNRLENGYVTASILDNTSIDRPGFFAVNVNQAGGSFTTGLSVDTATMYECPTEVFSEATCSEVFSDTVFAQETEQDFLKLAVTMHGTAANNNVPSDALLTISGERESPSVNSISSLRMASEGQLLALNGEFNSSGGIDELYGTDLNGTIVDIHSQSGERFGYVRNHSATEYVDMLDMGDWLKFTYSDGSFDSL